MGTDELSPGAEHLSVLVMMDLTALGKAGEKQCLIEMAGKPLCASVGRKEIKIILVFLGNRFVPGNRQGFVVVLL